jgi:hypothetical protein
MVLFWQLNINFSKCNVLHVGRTNKKYSYIIKGHEIPSSDCVKDLGIYVDSNLKFDQHVSRIVSKAYSRIACLLHGFISRDSNLLKKAYVTFIRPMLEYGANVWCPGQLKYIDTIERVQRYFTKRIKCLSTLTYTERLCRLDLESLELRRIKSDLMVYFKVIHNLTPFDPCDVFKVNINDCNVELRSRRQLVLPKVNNSNTSNNFFIRRINMWNSLPDSIRNADSITTFKRLLKSVDFSLFLTGSMWRL